MLSWTAPPSGQARLSARSLSSGTPRASGFALSAQTAVRAKRTKRAVPVGRVLCVWDGALRAPWILVPHYARSSLRGAPGFSVWGSPSIVSWWTTRPVSTSNSSWTQRSGPVGVGSSKGVAISDDGSSKGLFTLFWMARSAAVSPRMRQRRTAGRGGAGGAATVLPSSPSLCFNVLP